MLVLKEFTVTPPACDSHEHREMETMLGAGGCSWEKSQSGPRRLEEPEGGGN